MLSKTNLSGHLFLLGLGGVLVLLPESPNVTSMTHSVAAIATMSAQQSQGSQDPILTTEIIVRVRPGRRIQDIASKAQLKVLRPSLIQNAWVCSATSLKQVPISLKLMKFDSSVVEAFQNRILRNRKTRAFVPDDPFFANNAPIGGPDGGWPGQWYLVNSAGRATGDINIKPQWDLDTTGTGVTVGIVDDGVESSHPDLAPGYVATLSLNVETGAKGGTSGDPADAKSNHGTFTAGAAIARGGNGIGITGSAPFASWTAIRLPLGGNTLTDEMSVAVIEHESLTTKNIQIKNHSYGSSSPFNESENERAAIGRSSANGTIHVFAAGNDRGKVNQDAVKDPTTTAPAAIVVAALNSSSMFASYSSFGANLVCTCYGGDDSGMLGQIGTDRTGVSIGYSAKADYLFPDGNGNYVANQQGTSFTAPTVTGILALAKQRQPALNARWAKHLFALTSKKCDPTDMSPVGGWVTNTAGIKFNQNYGFGLVDVDAYVRLAQSSTGVSAVTSFDSGLQTTNLAIPDNSELSQTFNVAGATQPLEEVMVTLDIAHKNRGQLEAFLTSPGGTTHRVFIRSNADTGENIKWMFTMNGFWGEPANGTWTLRLADTVAGIAGTLNNYQVRMNMGSLSRGGR